MSGARRHVRGLWLGVSGVLLALIGPAWGTEISRAREVAPPPGDRGDLLYEVPIAPATPAKGSAPLPTASTAVSAGKVRPRGEVRDTISAPAPGATSSRQALKPSTPISVPARQPERRPGAASPDAVQGEPMPETARRTKASSVRPTLRDGREGGVSRETRPVAGQRVQVKPIAAAPASRAKKSEKAGKVDKTRDRAKVPTTKMAGEVKPSRSTSRTLVQPPRSSVSVSAKSGARQGDARASKLIVAKQAAPSKRAIPAERAAAKVARNASVTATARTARQSGSRATPRSVAKAPPTASTNKASTKLTPKVAQNAAKAAPKAAPKAATRPAPVKSSQPVKSSKPVPQKSPRAPSR